MNEVPYGYCHCGCGESAPIAKNDHSVHGWEKGKPIYYIHGHSSRGTSNPNWNGGMRIRPDGYVYIWNPGHPRSNRNYVMEHILVVEKAIGKFLLPPHEVHHINEIRKDNRNQNLVACEDSSYHKLLHVRIRAYYYCGHANWRKCVFCKNWDDPVNLIINTQNAAFHRECELENQKVRRLLKSGNYENPVSRFLGEI